MQFAWETCQAKDPARIRWGETGPRLVQNLVKRFGMEADVEPAVTFCPIDYPLWDRTVREHATLPSTEGAYAIHLWNELWRLNSLDKNAQYPADCLYEQLKSTYLQGVCVGS